jgi:hypothetical protein
MAGVVVSVRAEMRRYRGLAEGALEQLTQQELGAPGPGASNSAATIVWHIAGNLRSRFTDFLSSDGEKPWRNREEEFLPRQVSREELETVWASGWVCLDAALETLVDADLQRQVTIRGLEHFVHEALLRSVAHVAYHVGQLVTLGRANRQRDWKFLTIPPGATATYNDKPVREKG